MRYFYNFDFQMLYKGKEPPEPIKKNRVNDHGESYWMEIDEETYDKIYEWIYFEVIER